MIAGATAALLLAGAFLVWRTEAVKTIKGAGLEVPLITTEILNADEHAQAIFAAAASLGIREIKLGYHAYKTFGTYRADPWQVANAASPRSCTSHASNVSVCDDRPSNARASATSFTAGHTARARRASRPSYALRYRCSACLTSPSSLPIVETALAETALATGELAEARSSDACAG